MESASDLVFSLLRFLGFLDEPPPIRKRFKRNRIYDDFSSDDETPVMGYKQEKIFRWSNIIPTNERCDKERKRNSGIWNVQEQLNESHTTSTSKDSCQRTEPINYLRWSRNKPSSLPSKTAPVIDVEVYEQQEEPQVVWVNTKNTKKEASIVHVNLEDSDKNQRDDDVVFVEEVTTPPPNRPLEKSHAADLKKKVLSDILDETESYDNQNATSIKIKPMSKRKPIGDGKLAQDAASSRLPQKTRINVFDQINLDNELNAMQCNDMYQNAPKDHDPISVSSRDSSDSDVEVVPPKSTTTSSKKKDSDKDIKCMSRKWLLELDPNQQKNQENINDARPVSAIESNVNSTQNEARLSSAESIKEWLAKLDAKYFSTPVKTLEKLNDEHQDLSIVSKVNTEQNETLSYKPYTAGDRVLNLESKNNSGLLKSQEKPNDAPQESVSKLNTEQNEAQSIKLNNIREWVAGLKSTYVSTAQETQEDLSAVHKSNIVPKANSEQDGVYSFNLNTSKSPPLTAESEHEIDLQKSLKKLVDVRRESDIAKVKSEENEARSYLPSTSREWLSKLDAKYACIEHTMSQKNQGNLNDVRQKSALKVNSEQNEVRSLELNSTEEWLSELKSKCKYDFNKTHEKSNDSLRESTLLPKVISEQNEAWSYKPDNVEQRPSNLDCEHKTKKTAEKHQEVNSIDNTNRSFKFNTSEDLMVKLGSLYEKYQQETQGKNNNAHLKPDYTEQVSHQSQQNYELSNPKSIIVEIPADDDLPALTPDQGKLVDRALEPEPQEELLVEKFNIKIHRRDLQTLSDLNWLNDEVINFYMNLLMQRSEEREDLPKVYATNTFFYPKLMQSGQAGLRRWTRKVDIFAYDLFVVPVNVGSHWCICLVDFRAHIIKYLDSRGTPNQECLDALLQYLNDEHQDKKGAPFDASGWKTECLRDIPQQMNGSDCGMFACTFAEFSSRDAPYSFTQAQMPYLRRKAALEILMGKLLL